MGTTTLNIDEADLKRIYLLKGVESESIIGLLDLCTIHKLEPQEVLIVPDQPNRTVYFLLNGHLRVHLDSIETKPVAILQPGESVGEMSVIDHQPASAFVVADDACTLLAMDEEILWSLVQSSHKAACNLLYILVQRLRHADSLISVGSDPELHYQPYGSIDALTGLHNRYWLENMLKGQCLRSSMGEKPLSLIMIDVDYFKEFNDRYGRQHGDHVLYSIAHIISDLLRPADVITRYGVDEFIVVLPDLDIAIARQVAERLHRGVIESVPIMPDGESVPHPTISLGIVELEAGQEPEMLISAVYSALCRAKAAGRNCIAE
jgi:diguanylate cyclase (GGDEF)-like protein